MERNAGEEEMPLIPSGSAHRWGIGRKGRKKLVGE